MKSTVSLGIVLAILFSLLIVVPIVSAEKKSPDDEFKALHDDIQICNLLTGLYLSEEQVARITPLAQRAGALREEFESRRTGFARDNIALLTTMKREILETGDASPQTKQRHNAAKEAYDRVEERYQQEMKALNGDVQSILDENQKIIVAEYKPCLIPIKSISNPERIGSAGESDAILKVLSRARTMPEKKYLEKREQVLQKITPKLKKEFADEEIPAQLDNIRRVLDEARSMSDEEFELKKRDLALRIKPEKGENPRSALVRKIDRFLLNPRFVEVARQKQKNDRAGVHEKLRRDLSSSRSH